MHADSTIDPQTSAEVVIVPSGDEPLMTIYAVETGETLTLRRSLAGKLLRSHEFAEEPFDLDEALAGWISSDSAVQATVLAGIAEIRRKSCIPTDIADAINTVQAQAHARLEHLIRAVHALYRPEAEIAALAGHFLEHGSLEALHAVPELHAVAMAYAGAYPEHAREMTARAADESRRSTPQEQAT